MSHPAAPTPDQAAPLDLFKALEAAVTAAHAGAAILQAYAHKRSELVIDLKARNDLVSQADREAEIAIIEVLRARTPQFGIVAEETGGTPSGPASWYIDPLDGTTNFVKGRRMWGVSIGFCGPDDRVHVGVVTVPRQGETYTAVRGHGAARDGRPLRVSTTSAVRDALFTTGSHGDPRAFLPAWGRVMEQALSLRVTGALAPDLCELAAGESDGLWALEPGPWDVAAGTLIAAEAGAVVTDLAGTPLRAPHVDGVVAAPPTLHADLLRLLRDDTA